MPVGAIRRPARRYFYSFVYVWIMTIARVAIEVTVIRQSEFARSRALLP